ncbi:MAG TPA: hypothetical protein VH352_04260 [Pseudonocardiaceae bacterium]|jgi:hypothetical protein|nr:hypothetical protein [Pseudonocardiaceae bacterium]
MRTTQWTRRLAVTGCVAGIGLAVAGVGTAVAQGDPTTGPAPITISAAEVKQLCEVKVPPIKAEVTKLINWIDAGPTVAGSTQWLQAQAQQAQAGGHPVRADFLNGRLDRRAGVLAILQGIQAKINDFDSAHCAYLGSGS